MSANGLDPTPSVTEGDDDEPVRRAGLVGEGGEGLGER
jgi:hypothetical protein